MEEMTHMKNTNLASEWQEALINKPDFLKNALQAFIQNVLDQEFRSFIGVDQYERNETRQGYRNGCYTRSLKTRVGTLELRVARDRDGEFSPEVFEKYQRSEKALVLAILQMYVEGVSTRKVDAVVEELCGSGVSKSQVSALTKSLDEEIKHWRERPLTDEYAYLIVDARYDKVRENGRVVSKAYIVIVGITKDGKREILATFVGDSESSMIWEECFSQLKRRGLRGITYIVSDENKGLRAAISRHFQGVSWQRCQVHFMRNFIGKLTKSNQKEGIRLLKEVFAARDKDEVKERMKKLCCFLTSIKKEDVRQWVEENIEEALTVYGLPEEHRKRMKSTNMLERLNQELKRRSRVVRIFPNTESYLRLLTALCQEVSEGWMQKKYL
jgi:transposase-like protein